ncbi:competence protein TfoX [Clostridia bacterium]|nr:competence protein TfoX [Clostridia bacterium]
MATNPSTIEFLVDQIRGAGDVGYKKMFGEYMIYCNAKPVFLVCGDTLFIKPLPENAEFLKDKPMGPPYPSAKPHYIIENVDDREFMRALAALMERITPLPKKKR